LYELLGLYRLYRPQLADSTAETYWYAIRAFEKVCRHPPRLADLSEARLLEFAASRLADGGAQQTVRRELGTLFRLWRFAWRRKLGAADPRDVELPTIRLSHEPPIALTLAELEAVLSSAAREPGRMPHGPHAADWWVSLVLVLYYTAARISALLAVEWGDVDLETGWLHLGAGHAKTRLGQWHQLPECAVQKVMRLMRGRQARIWHWPYCRRQRHVALKRIMLRAGLPDRREYAFHIFRRTTATQLVLATDLSTAQRVLGHSREAMTARYIDPRQVSPDLGALLPRLNLD